MCPFGIAHKGGRCKGWMASGAKRELEPAFRDEGVDAEDATSGSDGLLALGFCAAVGLVYALVLLLLGEEAVMFVSML